MVSELLLPAGGCDTYYAARLANGYVNKSRTGDICMNPSYRKSLLPTKVGVKYAYILPFRDPTRGITLGMLL